MKTTYTKYAAVCAKFYELMLDQQQVGQFVLTRSGVSPGDRVLFVGSMFDIAQCLLEHGADLTIVDYSAEMVRLGAQRFPGVTVEEADLRALPYRHEFDFVMVLGRVFTHMISDDDLIAALRACHSCLKPSGFLFADNYEDCKIERTKYFNGELCVAAEDVEIRRKSTTSRVSVQPLVLRWDAVYQGVFDGQPFLFSDSMEQRAWSRQEIGRYLGQAGFMLKSQGDNFDDTSFFLLAQAT